MSSSPDPNDDQNAPIRVIGRYAMFGKLAAGGMASVHFGRLQGPVGFSRTVAIKCLHPQYSKDPEFVSMFLDEARVAARIQHPNVVSTLDIVSTQDELFLVMDYVRGESLSRLLRTAAKKNLTLPDEFFATVVAGILHGLHAAHEATDERGAPLKVVHRDVSAQNVLVAIDGVPRILDFGVAKAAARAQVTRDGQVKGKLSYMSPEQLKGRSVDRRSDVFSAGVLLWESLAGERLFARGEAREVLKNILTEAAPPPSTRRPSLARELDEVVLRALQKDPDARFQTAREFAIAIEESIPLLSPREVGEWVEEIAGESLVRREAALAEIESISGVSELSALSASDADFASKLECVELARQVETSQPSPSSEPAQGPLEQADGGEWSNAEQPGTAQAPRAGAGSMRLFPAPFEDPTQVFEMEAEGDVTSPRHFSKPPPQQISFSRRKPALVAIGIFSCLLLLALAFIGASSEDAPRNLAAPMTPKKVRASTAQAALSSNEPSEAVPRLKEEPAVTVSFEQLPVVHEASRAGKERGSEAARKKKSLDCARPYYVDPKGIRRIKSACL